jgi:hypothetical protein
MIFNSFSIKRFSSTTDLVPLPNNRSFFFKSYIELIGNETFIILKNQLLYDDYGGRAV